MPTAFEISARAVHQAATVLVDHLQDGLPFRELRPRIHQADPALAQDWAALGTTVKTDIDRNLSYIATAPTKAGWLTRANRTWRLTGLGFEALRTYPDPVTFFSEATTRYTYWRTRRASFDTAAKLLSELPDEQWVAVEDLAAEYEIDPEALAACLQGTRTEGWHLALSAEGEAGYGLTLLPTETDAWRALLERDELYDEAASSFDTVRALPAKRLTADALAALVLGEEPGQDGIPQRPRRVWVIRGTDTGGASLIRTLWRDEGMVTLPAHRLPALSQGTGPQRVRKAVDDADSGATSVQRDRRAEELHTFLSRIQEGDIVVCTDGPKAYLGVVRGPAVYTDPLQDAAYFTRPVAWQNLDAPLDFVADLPAELTGRVADADARIVDISEFASRLEPLVGPEPERAAPPPDITAVLPDATEELADGLFLSDASWLQESVDLLRGKPQLIFHGPPGTGKTYTALALARHLTGGSLNNVRLVQFHPAYTYEDFFEGFRPRLPKKLSPDSPAQKRERDADTSTGLVFDLVQGPLRRLATSAEERPAEVFVLVIDEINRGNLAKVFGEMYFLLEYRKEFVHLLYGSDEGRGFRLPPNLYIIGTMNTVDRTVALMDAAMRRRFSFMELHPDAPPLTGLLSRWLTENQHPQDAALLLDELNRRIAEGPANDRDFRVGHSYLMQSMAHSSPRALDLIWRSQVIPLLTEYHWGDGTDIEETYGLAGIREHLGLRPDDGA
ncbi:McrB family protein [Streptomyces anulatus]|uniref:McrB family protein n=1 Tax=Streptomyces anulatus TaxID=1892 RepID=UPI00068ACF30|nr:AAA family ATPase [Streptomyces anulatus]